MSVETFEKACQVNDECITLGGGEPTIHPMFFQYVGIALSYSGEVSVITNGKETDVALRLASMAKRGILSASLSLDAYHETIDEKVVKAFAKSNKKFNYFQTNDDFDLRGIRTVHRIIASGRGKNISGSEKSCICPELIIEPDGTIYACACQTKSFGTVFDYSIPNDYSYGDCWEWQLAQKEKQAELAELQPA